MPGPSAGKSIFGAESPSSSASRFIFPIEISKLPAEIFTHVSAGVSWTQSRRLSCRRAKSTIALRGEDRHPYFGGESAAASSSRTLVVANSQKRAPGHARDRCGDGAPGTLRQRAAMASRQNRKRHRHSTRFAFAGSTMTAFRITKRDRSLKRT